MAIEYAYKIFRGGTFLTMDDARRHVEAVAIADGRILVAEMEGEDIYRAKGFVYLHDDPKRRYIYQQVGSRWSLAPDGAWENEPRQTRLVVIGREGTTSVEAIDALLESALLPVCSSI